MQLKKFLSIFFLSLFLSNASLAEIPHFLDFKFIATLTVLALIEHWFMVLPLPDAKLWRWMIPAKSHSQRLNLTRSKDLTNKTV